METLEHEADQTRTQCGAGLLVQPAQAFAGERDLALAGQIQSGQQAEQGGLAGAGCTDDGDAVAFIDRQVDPVENADGPLRAGDRFADTAYVDRVDGTAGAGGQTVDGTLREMRMDKVRVLRWWMLAWLLLVPALACAKGPVLVVGDSLSAAHNIPVQSGWVSLMEQRIRREIKPPPAVVNASISGETTSGALTRLPGLLQKHRPSVVVIELGGNDALRGLTPVQLRGNLEKMIVLSRDAGAKVLLLGIDVPPNYGPAYRERLRRSYSELSSQYGTGLVPFLLEGVALQPGLMQSDGLHPTAAAQPKVLETVWPALEPLL